MKHMIVLILLFVAGCADQFAPNGTYIPRLVVYGVMDATRSTQYIRVRSTFAPSQYDPLAPSPNTAVTNASVTVKDGTVTTAFGDTVIVSGSGEAVHVYVATGLQPVAGKNYVLTVAAPGYDTVRSAFAAVGPGDVRSDATLLSKPSGETKTIPVMFLPGTNTAAYLAMIILEYRVGNDPTLHLKEVPSTVMLNADGTVAKRFYPSITLLESAGASGFYRESIFSMSAYMSALDDVRASHPDGSVTFTRVIVRLEQFDANLYTYYSVVNSFGSSATIRLDEPDFSAVTNGYGTFGMMTRQDRTYQAPAK